MTASGLAVAAALIIRIERDDEEDDAMQIIRAALVAVRPVPVDEIAEAANRALATEHKAAA